MLRNELQEAADCTDSAGSSEHAAALLAFVNETVARVDDDHAVALDALVQALNVEDGVCHIDGLHDVFLPPRE